MKYLVVCWLLVAVCKLKNTHAICWDTGCLLDSWAVRGCGKYGMIETSQKPCPNGIIYSCCNQNRIPAVRCWDIGCQNRWAVRGCQQYGMIETGQKSCPSGIIFSCCEANQTSTNRISQKYLDTGCSSNKFECDSGNCIDQKFACDGIRHCDDGTDETIKKCENNRCSENQFRCGYGACIDSELECDGVMHCLDGSDELSELCEAQPTIPPLKPTLSRIIRSSALESCTLPADSPDKKFTVQQCPNNGNCCSQPGEKVPEYTEIHFTCNPGYQSDDENPLISVCLHKESWFPPSVNCSKICKPLNPKNVNLVCYRKGLNVDCSGTLVAGTIVYPRCKLQHHEEFQVYYTNITCQADGEWTKPLFSCVPDCGKPHAKITKLLISETREKYGDSPWHVAVYDIWQKDKTLICGGTIISPQLILSAAHCFFDEYNETVQATDRFEILVSKVSRNYYTMDNGSTKRYKIREILFSPLGFTGRSTNYAADIVIIWLAEKISLNEEVMPACIRWIDDSIEMLENLQGKLVGWGENKNGDPSEFLLSANLSFISRAECIRTANRDFRKSLTLDKFCAGSKSGAPAGARPGDSGGGLMFPDAYLGLYYLRGIVSIKDDDDPSVTVFTNVGEYIKWISDVKRKVENEVLNFTEDRCASLNKTSGEFDCVIHSECTTPNKLDHNGETVLCGTDIYTGANKICCPKKAPVLQPITGRSKVDPYAIAQQKCREYAEARYVIQKIPSDDPNKPVTFVRTIDCPLTKPLIDGGTVAKPKEFPHMVLIGFSKDPNEPVNNTVWNCGGTLISDRFVLTAAHCERSGEYVATWVRLDELILDNDSDSAQPKDFVIEERIPHPEFRTSSVYFDIMLLKLKVKVQFTPHMRPICLFTHDALTEHLQNQVIITGWGSASPAEGEKKILMKFNVHTTHKNECIASYMGDTKFTRGYDPTTMFCVAESRQRSRHGDDICITSGGPLLVPIPNQRCMYSQIGIASNGKMNCGQKEAHSIYTSVSYYLPWIQSIVWP